MLPERPHCKCHGVPMYPNNDGKWRCRVKVRARQKAAERTLTYFVKRRRRDLRKLRTRLTNQLDDLRRETT